VAASTGNVVAVNGFGPSADVHGNILGLVSPFGGISP